MRVHRIAARTQIQNYVIAERIVDRNIACAPLTAAGVFGLAVSYLRNLPVPHREHLSAVVIVVCVGLPSPVQPPSIGTEQHPVDGKPLWDALFAVHRVWPAPMIFGAQRIERYPSRPPQRCM